MQELVFAEAKAKIMADYNGDEDYDVSFDCKSVKNINESRWTEEEFFNWASEGNIFLSLAHFHQGVGSTLAWSVEEIWRQFSKLKSVIHYPSKKCSAFSQDKVQCLYEGDCLPFYVVPIPLLDDTAEIPMRGSVLKGLLQFIHLHETVGCKFVVKIGYTTSGSAFSKKIYCDDVNQILLRISLITKLSNKLRR